MWGLFRTRDRFSLEELRHLTEQLHRHPVVTEANKDIVVETLRSLAELIIWGDQHEPAFFEFFMANNILGHFLTILRTSSRTSGVPVQLLQTLNIMIQNIRSEKSIYQMFSREYINSIIIYPFDFSDEELLAYYISFLRTISMKVDNSTIEFFLVTDRHRHKDFPLYTEAIKFFHHEESMVRIAVRTLTLNVYSVRDERARSFVLSRTAVPYFEDLANFVRQQSQTLDSLVNDAALGYVSRTTLGRLEGAIAEIGDLLYYCNDVMNAGIEELSAIMSQHLLSILVFPVLLEALAAPTDLAPAAPGRLSPLCAMYLLSRLLHVVTYKPFLEAVIVAISAAASAPSSSAVAASSPSPPSLEKQLTRSRSSREGGSLQGRPPPVSKRDRRRTRSTEDLPAVGRLAWEQESGSHGPGEAGAAGEAGVGAEAGAAGAGGGAEDPRRHSLGKGLPNGTTAAMNSASDAGASTSTGASVGAGAGAAMGEGEAAAGAGAAMGEGEAAAGAGSDRESVDASHVTATRLEEEAGPGHLQDEARRGASDPGADPRKDGSGQALVGSQSDEELRGFLAARSDRMDSDSDAELRRSISPEEEDAREPPQANGDTNEPSPHCTCGASTMRHLDGMNGSGEQVLDALVVLLCKRPPRCAEAIWHAGWLLRQLAPPKEHHSSPRRLRLLNGAHASARDDVAAELVECWCDLIPSAIEEEWKFCRKAFETPSLQKDSSIVLMPNSVPLISKGDVSSAALGERMRTSVKVFVALCQIRLLLQEGTLPESPPAATPSPPDESARTGRRGITLGHLLEGTELDLTATPGDAMPCKVAFERGKERAVLLLVSSEAALGCLLLAETLPRPHEVVIRVVAPLAGSKPEVDRKHKKWLHLRIRSPQLPPADAGTLGAQSTFGLKPRAKRLADGRWTLAFQDEEQCRTARLAVLEEICVQSNLVREMLEPLLGPLPPFRLGGEGDIEDHGALLGT
eukprot:jgi/Mesen1/2796/ME000170S01896